jgi:hypothetical protein
VASSRAEHATLAGSKHPVGGWREALASLHLARLVRRCAHPRRLSCPLLRPPREAVLCLQQLRCRLITSRGVVRLPPHATPSYISSRAAPMLRSQYWTLPLPQKSRSAAAAAGGASLLAYASAVPSIATMVLNLPRIASSTSSRLSFCTAS